ncbi:hypothetical protein [Methylomagnum ishizawai]|uniref:hypothetical protein n=1 Tax=Methylomagnum ishizawai TaxID=1760988 RepID=UPI000F736D47|nr:hypothetical protein [Methylomagnum ishizawai]
MNEFAWIQSIPWLLVVLGWYLVNRQNNSREKRKELRALLDQTQKLLDEIEIQAVEYHTVEATVQRAFFLKRALGLKLHQKFEILSKRSLELRLCKKYHIELRKAITLSNFDSAKYEKKELSDQIIKDIWLAKDRLSHELETCFVKEYD